jgi:prepilin peptidase CpaA
MGLRLIIHWLPLLVLLIWASLTDLRERRIPNWLTVSLALIGLAQSASGWHQIGPGQAILGLLVGFGITFILFAIGALGGGDVKLMGAVGAWVGPAGALAVFCLAAIIGMLIVIVQAIWQGRLKTLIGNSAVLTVNLLHLREVGVEHAKATGRSCRSVDRPLPYAVPVLLAVAALISHLWTGV